jgi:hypothetical protein
MRAAPLRERLDKTTLERLYWCHNLTTVEIAERYGSHSPNVVVLMQKYGIPRRTRGGGKVSAIRRRNAVER